LQLPRAKKWNVVDLPNIQSDSEAFANYLVTKYDQLAEYTVFAPVSPPPSFTVSIGFPGQTASPDICVHSIYCPFDSTVPR